MNARERYTRAKWAFVKSQKEFEECLAICVVARRNREEANAELDKADADLRAEGVDPVEERL